MTAARPQAGLTLAHKPAGATSFSLVRDVQARLAAAPGKALKVCHGGALDPFAHGLLPLLVGPATRLFELLHDAPKAYVATVAWGAETDSLDAGGKVVREGRTDGLTSQALDGALARFVGSSAQVPPAMSNKRVGGERAWAKARRGEAVALEPVRVYLHSARWTAHALPASSTLELVCRGGFYVRALARDVGAALGAFAHLRALHRTAIGPWEDPGPGVERALSGRALLPWLPWRALSDDEWGAARRGGVVPRGEVHAPDWALPAGFPPPAPVVRAVHQERLVAVLTARGEALGASVLLPGGV